MNSLIERSLQLIARKRRAKAWGITFNRVKTFQLPDTLHLQGKQVELNFPKGDSSLASEFIEVILDDCYKLDSLKKKIKLEPKILDIGGNIGLFGLAARNAFPRAQIHCYEPNPALESYLKHQGKIASLDYFMSALGSQDGKVTLKFSNSGASGNTRSFVDETGTIPCLALTKAIDHLGGQVDLAKIDCEGAEWDLFNAPNVWDKVQNITMEYHLFQKGQTLEKLQEIIQSLGFKIVLAKPINQYYGNLIASRA